MIIFRQLFLNESSGPDPSNPCDCLQQQKPFFYIKLSSELCRNELQSFRDLNISRSDGEKKAEKSSKNASSSVMKLGRREDRARKKT